MKTRVKKLISISTIPVLALALLVVLGTVLAAGPAADGHRHDIAAINELMNQYAAAVNAGDLELYLSLHTDDVVKMPPNAPATFGQEALRASMEPIFDVFDCEMTINSEEVQVSGRLALSRCTYTLSITPKTGGETIIVEPDGKALGICKRQHKGSWKFSHDCFNSNVP